LKDENLGNGFDAGFSGLRHLFDGKRDNSSSWSIFRVI
jgi:hypothetical protein